MEENFNYYEAAPGNYSACFSAGCPRRGECLHALVARDIPLDKNTVLALNPKLTADVSTQACPFFRKAERVRVAYGFKAAMDRIPAGRARGLKWNMTDLFCTRNFYYLRRGDKPIYPDMQKRIAAALKENGLQGPMEFDRYEWEIDW